MSSSVQFDIETGVSYTENLDNNGLRINMYFSDHELALKILNKLKLEIEILVLTHSVDLSDTIDLTDDNPRISSDTLPCPPSFES